MNNKTANWIAGIAVVIAIFSLFCFDFSVLGKVWTIVKKPSVTDWLMVLCTALMALFAAFSLGAAKKQQKSQETLLKEQNNIQIKQRDDQERLMVQQNKIMNEQKNIARREYLLYKFEKLSELSDALKKDFYMTGRFFSDSNSKTNFLEFFDKMWMNTSTVLDKLQVFYQDDKRFSDYLILYEDMINYVPHLSPNDEGYMDAWIQFYDDYISDLDVEKGEVFTSISSDLIKIGQELKELEDK